MGRGNSRTRHAHNGNDTWAIQNGKEPWKRERPTRNQAPPPTLPNDDDVDVHGILFAVMMIVFVVYPLVQWALGR